MASLLNKALSNHTIMSKTLNKHTSNQPSPSHPFILSFHIHTLNASNINCITNSKWNWLSNRWEIIMSGSFGEKQCWNDTKIRLLLFHYTSKTISRNFSDSNEFLRPTVFQLVVGNAENKTIYFMWQQNYFQEKEKKKKQKILYKSFFGLRHLS